MSDTAAFILLVTGGLVVAGGGVGGCLYYSPRYEVYSSTLHGQALLKEAESTRKVAIEEAKAKKESSQELAEAEIIRAKGVAEANKIIGDSLKGNDAYLRYLWIQGLQDGSSEVIYIPTEANLPILEAGKRPERTIGERIGDTLGELQE